MRIPVTQMSNETLLRQLLDAMPSYVFLVDKDVSILDYNAAAGEFLGLGRRAVVRHRFGEVFDCLHAEDAPQGCGHGPQCCSCPIRSAVREAFSGHKCVRQQVRMELRADHTVKQFNFLLTASPFIYKGHERVVLILEDLAGIAAGQPILHGYPN